MAIDENLLRQTRQALLAAFDDMAIRGVTLRELVEQARTRNPQILSIHSVNDTYPGIEAERIRWSGPYYDKQKAYARSNLSPERLLHLIDVRDHLQAQHVKGFTASTTTRERKDMASKPALAETGMSSAEYQPSENLVKFVEGGELRLVRAALRFELNDNRLSRQHLIDALEWARGRVDDLCEQYEEKALARPIKLDRGNWAGNYYDKQTGYLASNFSSERYLHLVDVRMYLRERNVKGFVSSHETIGDTDELAYLPASNTEDTKRTTQVPSIPTVDVVHPSPSNERNLPFFKLAVILGGALAAVAILLTLVR